MSEYSGEQVEEQDQYDEQQHGWGLNGYAHTQ